MFKIAEFLGPEPNEVWDIIEELGIKHVVAQLPTDLRPGERPWEYEPLRRMQDKFSERGLTIDVIESRPPMEKAKRGLPGGEEEIDTVCELLTNMGRLGIKNYCYEWMATYNWIRTSRIAPERGGALVTEFNIDKIGEVITDSPEPVSEETLWKTLEHFINRVIPVAEKAGVVISMHPDDPPLSPINGISRIMRSIDAYDRLLAMSSSPSNTIAFCQANFSLMDPDIVKTIHHFGKRISFVHFRNITGKKNHFRETFHDNGMIDMLAAMKAYKDIGFDGPMRPDHVPTMRGDSNENAGYSAIGRLYAVGYMRGLQLALYGERDI